MRKKSFSNTFYFHSFLLLLWLQPFLLDWNKRVVPICHGISSNSGSFNFFRCFLFSFCQKTIRWKIIQFQTSIVPFCFFSTKLGQLGINHKITVHTKKSVSGSFVIQIILTDFLNSSASQKFWNCCSLHGVGERNTPKRKKWKVFQYYVFGHYYFGKE